MAVSYTHLDVYKRQPYVARLPCREGLRIEFPLDGADRLTLDIEVDVRDSVRSRGPGRR